jgi:hypothetical protein
VIHMVTSVGTLPAVLDWRRATAAAAAADRACKHSQNVII